MLINNSDPVFQQRSQLCLSCGLCCQGIFFFQDEDPQKHNLSPELENPFLPLTCRLLQQGTNRCLIYNECPPACKTFQCGLLKQLQQEEITFEQAQAAIEKIKTLLNTLIQQLPPAQKTQPFFEQIQYEYEVIKLELASENRARLNLFMDMAWFIMMVERHISPLNGWN